MHNKHQVSQNTERSWAFNIACTDADYSAGAPAVRRGRGGSTSGGGTGGGGNQRGRGRFNMRRDGPMKFEKDFDFESANAQFNKEEIDRELQSKLKIKGTIRFLKASSTSSLNNVIEAHNVQK